MPSSLHGQKGVECAGMAKHVEMRECWWRHLSGGRLVEGSNAHIATKSLRALVFLLILSSDFPARHCGVAEFSRPS